MANKEIKKSVVSLTYLESEFVRLKNEKIGDARIISMLEEMYGQELVAKWLNERSNFSLLS